jgi:hypothetical protein
MLGIMVYRHAAAEGRDRNIQAAFMLDHDELLKTATVNMDRSMEAFGCPVKCQSVIEHTTVEHHSKDG